MSIVTTDGGLTAFGYGLSILAAALFFFIAGMISRNQKTKISARQLVFCGTAIALAYLTSYIRLIPKMPYGGSVTLFSMLFICLIGYWYGIRAGIMTGLALWHSSVYSGALCSFPVSGMLRLCSGLCRTGTGRTVLQIKKRSGQRLSPGNSGSRPVSCYRRLSLLDGLYAGEFPPAACHALPDCL